MNARLAKIFATLLILSIASGCAAIRGKEIPRIDKITVAEETQKRPKAYISLESFNGKPNDIKEKQEKVMDSYRNRIKSVLSTNPVFEEYSFDPSFKEQADIELRVERYTYSNNEFWAYFFSYLTGYTLGIVPAFVTDHTIVTVEMVDIKNETQLGYAKNKDSVTVLIGLIFLPFMIFDPFSATSDTFENQFKVAVSELINKKS